MSNPLDMSLAAIERLRADRPVVHCITNTVAQYFTANVLLACGAIPSMSVAFDEISDFTNRADALLVNLGTMDVERTKSSRWAFDLARKTNKPVVLDPVFAQASTARLILAKHLASRGPTIIRANPLEVQALFGDRESGYIARGLSTCLVVTGALDTVTDGSTVIQIANGADVMTRITAMGCALTALMAAISAVEHDPVIASLAALLWFNIAGEIAAGDSTGPGTFVPRFIDALTELDAATITSRAKLS